MSEIRHWDAINFFNEHGYLIIDSMRQSGKSRVLKEIIKTNANLRIAVKCANRRQFELLYSMYTNCTYIFPYVQFYPNHYDIIIGDEIYIEPRKDIKTACAYTNKYIQHSLSPADSCLDIEEFKNRMCLKQFETEFGQYLE